MTNVLMAAGEAALATMTAEAAGNDAQEVAASLTGGNRRSPVYMVFELRKMKDDRDDNATAIAAWVIVGHKVKGATDRKAIEAVIGTAEKPVEGFDDKRRLGTFVAVLTRHWQPPKRKRVVPEDWA